jgi:hypothetical protein
LDSWLPIYFYIPKSDWPDPMPKDANSYWLGFCRGIYCWTLQTYLHLKESGFPVELVSEIPEEGIILAHWDSLPKTLVPSPRQLIVCLQADRDRHPYAQVHIVQNRQGLRKDSLIWGDRHLFSGSTYYVPHWPQPGLVKRFSERGSLFENLCFFGLENNLLPELLEPTWTKRLESIGINWCVVSQPKHWNDYSNVDAVLAIRSFRKKDFIWKPATKLFNAWHGGVPAILGVESAYQAERRSKLDYCEVTSIEEAFEAVQYLKEHPDFVKSMVENGKHRARETDRDLLVQRWTSLLENKLKNAYYVWTKCSFYRQLFKKRRALIQKYRAR